MKEDKHPSDPQEMLLWDMFERMDRRIRSLSRRWQDRFDSEMGEDCRQEAFLLLCPLGDKLQAMPPEKREHYAAVCVRHGPQRFLQREQQYQARTVPFEELRPREKLRAEAGGEADTV